jgi:hypothetical protein
MVAFWMTAASYKTLLRYGCRDVGYRGFWFFPWLESKSQQEQQAVVAKTLKLMADGTMSPPVGECWAAAAVCEQRVLCTS